MTEKELQLEITRLKSQNEILKQIIFETKKTLNNIENFIIIDHPTNSRAKIKSVFGQKED
tara:strand:- start:101 stop:280 length:180 start_codon:yes stop_codon:yes gene_type:complete